MTLNVVYFHRKLDPQYFSLERVFSDVREHLPRDIHAVVAHCPRESNGILNRIVNILWARRSQGDINHITGDVHYLTLMLGKKRTILTVHDCVPLERSRGLKRWLLWLLWYRLPQANCAQITTISDFTKSELLRHLKCSLDKVTVIYDPCSARFNPCPKPFNADCPVVLQVGTAWNKNLHRVAGALKGIRCNLIIVGALDEAQRRCLVENGIQYTRHQGISDEELVGLYEECDLLVFASLYEGFGLPIVEAQAVGRAVVTSNRCSMPEVAGDAACLVDPESVESIRQGLLRVLGDRPYRESLIEKGFENVKRFAPAKIAEQYATIYRTMTS